jgi:hypothetical protein
MLHMLDSDFVFTPSNVIYMTFKITSIESKSNSDPFQTKW